MSDESADESSKTEEATSRKLDEARKKGQTFSSRELNHFFMVMALLVFILWLAPSMGHQALALLGPFVTQPESFAFDEASLNHLFRELLHGVGILMLLPALVAVIACFLPSVVQNKWIFAVENIRPKFSKLSPLEGAKKLFSIKGIIEFAKNLLKISFVGAVGIMVLMPYRDMILMSLRTDNAQVLGTTGYLAGKVLISTCIILFLLSAGDYFYQRFTFLKSMRMTKQEVKDEYKQQEGDPHVKGKFKQIRRERSRRQMMANVPKANVIITNPTHFAVALQYEADTMQAPKLLAKGADEVAFRIREIAEKHRIPIVRNPPLARALFDTAEIDETIPVAQYQAVARVISYVYKIKGRTLSKPKTQSVKAPRKK